MKIKEPDSDNALQSLYGQIDFTRNRMVNCINQNHDTTTVLYISSLIITPNVVFNGRRLLHEISDIVNLSPRCICLVRTTASSCFPPGMRNWQKRSIDFLRGKCYVVVYSKHKEFLNHAKFLLHYQVCFSEGTVHSGDFYGSTNLTARGLGNPSGRGNFEEYMKHDGVKYKLSSRDRSYLSEVLELIRHKALLYTDRRYLSQHLSDHLRWFESLLHYRPHNPSKPPRRELYDRYLDLLVAYNQAFAFLDEIPGKKLTEEITEKMAAIRPSANPFEIDMMSVDPNYTELILEELDLGEEALNELAGEIASALGNALDLIKERYQPAIERTETYLDAKETIFLEYLTKNNETHLSDLKKMLMVTRLDKF